MTDPARDGDGTTGERGDHAADGDDTAGRPDDDHLAGVDDGAGCTEIWEHLEEARRKRDDDTPAETDDGRDTERRADATED